MREWDPLAYDRLSQPQQSWGKKVLSRVRLRGDESVLDAGCGTGKLTRELLHALPQGRVVALDLSQRMLLTARQNLEAETGSRLHFVAADFTALPFNGVFDGIFSTAALHWVKNHGHLFESLFGALRPGGWLITQCGGGPNLARLRARFHEAISGPTYSPYFVGFEEPWLFSDPETAEGNMRHAGFVEVETSLEEEPTTFESAAIYRDFISKVVFGAHLERIPPSALRDALMSQLCERAAADNPPFTLDYWRLNLRGRRPDSGFEPL
jgi:ubiquinone/menaquinone biosynthesis C-methylase UbiE